jgi:hypothetical protein
MSFLISYFKMPKIVIMWEFENLKQFLMGNTRFFRSIILF